MVDYARATRMSKRIQQIVANALEQEIKDPRVELITITDVKVTGDLHDATVYYTVRGKNIDDEPDAPAAGEALKKARGQLRKIVGDQLGVRYTPTLAFEYDSVPQNSADIEELLAKARQKDEEVRELAKYGTPALDNPYKDEVEKD